MPACLLHGKRFPCRMVWRESLPAVQELYGMDFMCRTKNKAERAVIDQLESQGYQVLKRGWPDLLAFNKTEVRFIEVKRLRTSSGKLSTSQLKPDQLRVAEVLKRCGLTVELVRG